MTLRLEEQLYLKWQEAYYKGNPLVSDYEYDLLESELKAAGSKVTDKVGGDTDKDNKIPHMSPMLSLDKVQVNDETKFPDVELSDWCKNRFPLEAMPKLDGAAVELQYENGELKLALTRGKEGKGKDITSKMIHLGVPDTISDKRLLEVRGEVVVPLETFISKQEAGDPDYKDAANPRNFIPGLFNRDVISDTLRDCIFVAYSLKHHNSTGYEYVDQTQATLSKLGFNSRYPIPLMEIKSVADFRKAYDFFLDYRIHKSPFQLDGIVFKMQEKIRNQVGYGKKYPKWGMALKFIAVEAVTEIIDIEWKVGATGELASTGILKPVEVDGSIVRRVSLYNKSKIEELGTFIGAVVSIKKSGDIIPKVVKVIRESPRKDYYIKTQEYYPNECPSCKSWLEVDDKHIVCTNEECEAQAVRKLAQGIKALQIEEIGEPTALLLFKAGVTKIHRLFYYDLQDYLLKSGHFKPGRSLQILLDNIGNLKQIELWRVIYALQFNGLGNTISQQIANYIAKIDYSWAGLEKAVIDEFIKPDSEQYKRFEKLVSMLEKRGVKIVYPEPNVVSETDIVFEMTGSPSNTNFAIKKDFTDFLKTKGYRHDKLKNASLLITDSMSSSSSKMVDAKKRGIEIITYEDLVSKLTN